MSCSVEPSMKKLTISMPDYSYIASSFIWFTSRVVIIGTSSRMPQRKSTLDLIRNLINGIVPLIITRSSPRPRGYKAFSCSTHLSTKCILLINVKVPTIVGILTFISIINTTSENFFICRYMYFVCLFV